LLALSLGRAGFFVWLDDNEAVALEAHLKRLAASATEECLQPDVRLELGGQIS
jgi:hypothetical protein